MKRILVTVAFVLSMFSSITMAGMNRKPAVLSMPDPVYPAALKAKGVAGFAELRITLDAKGKVVSVDVIRASLPEFGVAAKNAAEHGQYTGGIKDGVPVETRFNLPITFRIVNEGKNPPPQGTSGKVPFPATGPEARSP